MARSILKSQQSIQLEMHINEQTLLSRYIKIFNFEAEGVVAVQEERFKCDLVLNGLPCGFPDNATKDDIGSDIYYKVTGQSAGKWTK